MSLIPGNSDRVRQAYRLARILTGLRLIQSCNQWNAKAIASELEVALRTVYRDLQTLESAGGCRGITMLMQNATEFAAITDFPPPTHNQRQRELRRMPRQRHLLWGAVTLRKSSITKSL
jgi:DeoR/GlpR family transcriptional regulator of sugar metabolism